MPREWKSCSHLRRDLLHDNPVTPIGGYGWVVISVAREVLDFNVEGWAQAKPPPRMLFEERSIRNPSGVFFPLGDFFARLHLFVLKNECRHLRRHSQALPLKMGW